MSHHQNLVRIKGVYHALGNLQDEVAFVGGATLSLYSDNPTQADVRTTNDVDVLIEIGTYGEYERIQARLNALKFVPDATSSVICRYRYQGLIVDIMPTDERLLGFTNRWYRDGFAHLQKCKIDEHTTINIFPSTYFLACKLEAFNGRGKGDGRFSQDFEDIVFLLDNRTAIWSEIDAANEGLKHYLRQEFTSLYHNRYLHEWISAHLEYLTARERANMMVESMAKLVIPENDCP